MLVFRSISAQMLDLVKCCCFAIYFETYLFRSMHKRLRLICIVLTATNRRENITKTKIETQTQEIHTNFVSEQRNKKKINSRDCRFILIVDYWSQWHSVNCMWLHFLMPFICISYFCTQLVITNVKKARIHWIGEKRNFILFLYPFEFSSRLNILNINSPKIKRLH